MTQHRGVGNDSSRAPRLTLLCSMVLSALAGWHSDARGTTVASGGGNRRAAPTQVASVQFDSGFLNHAAGGIVDLSRFEKGNAVLAGTYRVDIYVNDDYVATDSLDFHVDGDSVDAQPCFDVEGLKGVGVDTSKLSAATQAKLADGACMRLAQAVTDARLEFVFGEQRLNLSIPQGVMRRKARGYVSPDRWDSGVTVGMLDYNVSLYSNRTSGGRTLTQGYAGMTAGLNVGNWHFRHEGAYSWADGAGGRYQDISTYVQRDVPALSAQLTLGEAYTSGELFDSTQFRGVKLAFDDRMLPDSMRGYAPTVRGVARSNARVSISQNGMRIYETTVAPGAFVIDDLYPSGYGGDLVVAVTEADGSTHSFTVPYAAVPLSLRPGMHRYSAVAGTVRDTRISGNPAFVQATWQQGLTNFVTGYAGATVAQGYASAMVGAAFNTSLGALGLDVTHATTSVPGDQRYSGISARVSYAKAIAATGTSISIAAYRYSTSGYFGLNDAMVVREQARQGNSIDALARQRSKASLSVSQRLGERAGQLAVTTSATNYWNRNGSVLSYSLSYANTFRGVSYGISVVRQRNGSGRTDTVYYAGVTIPLGKTSSLMATASVTHDTNGQTQLQTSLSGTAGKDDTLYYNIGASRTAGQGSQDTQGNGSLVYRAPYGELSASLGGGERYQQASVGLRGGVVAHAGGVTLSQPLSETFAIVRAKEAAGARVLNAPGVRIDGRGYAIVPFLTPYSMNALDLDPEGLSTDVELRTTSQQVAPRAGAVPLVEFPTSMGRSALITAKRSNGSLLPFGAAVTDDDGREVGVVGQANRMLVRGLQDKGTLTVRWNGDTDSACRLSYALPKVDVANTKAAYRRLEAVCE